MKTKRDCYEILGLSKNATANEIKKAYRKLAKKYHPDTNAGNAQAEERFKEVTEAYGILSDEEKKRLYDQFGYAAFDGSNPGAEGQNTRQGGYREYHFTGEDMGDIFQDIFGNEFHGDALYDLRKHASLFPDEEQWYYLFSKSDFVSGFETISGNHVHVFSLEKMCRMADEYLSSTI